MNEPELLDVVELLINLPKNQLTSGEQGTIVVCYDDGKYDGEFANTDDNSPTICTLSSEQFIVVWKAKTKTWLSLPEQVAGLVSNLSEEKKREVLDFARFLLQR
ncbi:MAG: DUF4926 domain-containing protein [Oscillatoria sp. PMC 1051.18]|nr:DUF4926 domain-containing protein [Oscillatoria sp. PMC 1050.18]MEC5031252.1 DUF4926 domain-containing protein [Oscillatoria sp. PMC 1051.18]